MSNDITIHHGHRNFLDIPKSAAEVHRKVQTITKLARMKPRYADVWLGLDFEVYEVGTKDHFAAESALFRFIGRYDASADVDMIADDIRAMLKSQPISGLVIKDK